MPPLSPGSAPSGRPPESGCPCSSGRTYAACCGLVHAGTPARTAEILMRSRFSAFALGLDGHLLATWHPTTRPESLDLDESVEWRRLQIVDTEAGGETDATGLVEFRASFRERRSAAPPAGGTPRQAAGAPMRSAAGLLHERSRFLRLEGRWVYLDGDVMAA